MSSEVVGILSLDGRGYGDLAACRLVGIGEGDTVLELRSQHPPLQELLGNKFPSQLFPLPQGVRSTLLC
jgi:hypothetical protein